MIVIQMIILMDVLLIKQLHKYLQNFKRVQFIIMLIIFNQINKNLEFLWILIYLEDQVKLVLIIK